jgi:prolyl oligopeptidase
LVYPAARRGSDTVTLWGKTVPDPYQWLEDEKSEETRTWLEAQIALTQAHFNGLPTREALRRHFTRAMAYATRSAPWTRGQNTFFWGNEGTKSFDTLYVQAASDRTPRVLFDANQLSDDASIYMVGQSISWDGKYMAYGLTSCGSDWHTWKVRDVASGEDLPDQLEWVRFSGAAWAANSAGFYYCRYPEPVDRKAVPAHQKLYYHSLGCPQSEDTLVYERPGRKFWRFGVRTTEDGRYIVIIVYPSASGFNMIYYKDLDTGAVVQLFDKLNTRWSFIENDGPRLWFATSLEAPRGRVVAVDVSKQPAVLTEVIAEKPDQVLQDVAVVGDCFFVSYCRDALTTIEEHQLDGTLVGNVELPGIGTASGFEGRRQDTALYYHFQSYTTPAVTYRYDIASGQSSVHFKPEVAIEPSRYVTKLLFALSKDGVTQVPLFVSYRKGLKLNSMNPTLLYGYGGFGTSIYPAFSSRVALWMDLGGVYAAAGIRGGGEYGARWHEAGIGVKKQNSIDDFIGCARHLIASRYTNSARLAMLGESNGGLLIGGCMTQCPDLWAAAVAGNGVMDLLRYHLFTAGREWRKEYGCAEDSEQAFAALLNISPYHNLAPGTSYPATLVMCSAKDDRVVPLHSRKFTAALQAAQASARPCLMRVEHKAGHFGAAGLDQQIAAYADVFAFLIDELAIPARKLRRLRD